MNDELNTFNLERRSIKEKLDKSEISADMALKELKDIENREIAFKKAESERAITSLAEDTMQKMKQTAQEVEQRMLSIQFQPSGRKTETRAIEAIKNAYTERRDITIGTPELGQYDVIQEVFTEIKKTTPLIAQARTYSVPTANAVFPIMSAISGITAPNESVSYNNAKIKGTKGTANADEAIPTSGAHATVSLSTKLVQPKLNIGYVGLSWEALNQGAIRSDDQLVPAFQDAFAQIIEAGVMNGGNGLEGISAITGIDASHTFTATAATAAQNWTQLVSMATTIAAYVPYGASIIMSPGYKAFLINEGIGTSGGHFLAQELARSNTILGVPVIVEPNMTYTTGNGVKAYGYPMSDYGLVYVNGLSFVWKDGEQGDASRYLEARFAFGGAPVVGAKNIFVVQQTV